VGRSINLVGALRLNEIDRLTRVVRGTVTAQGLFATTSGRGPDALRSAEHGEEALSARADGTGAPSCLSSDDFPSGCAASETISTCWAPVPGADGLRRGRDRGPTSSWRAPTRRSTVDGRASSRCTAQVPVRDDDAAAGGIDGRAEDVEGLRQRIGITETPGGCTARRADSRTSARTRGTGCCSASPVPDGVGPRVAKRALAVRS